MYICIEGNIGCGKSSVLKAFAMNNFVVFPEPLEKWTLLEELYRDPEKYAYPFQLQVVLSQIETNKAIRRLSRSCVKIMERHGGRPRTCSRTSGIGRSPRSYVLDSCYDLIDVVPEYYIYLDSTEGLSPAQLQRNRFEERNISLDYLIRLDERYKEELSKLKNTIVIDCGSMTTEQIVKNIRDILAI
uniref:Thymidine kinase n=1 Tax=Diadromus pulchellus ascovirus 4a TaxID=158683 RepID=Q8JKE9_9VIRU|nr:thymidine kinase [Diadromus pulchellus ascovirus 4a]